MKKLFYLLIFVLAISLVNAQQPCKLVRQGMTKSEVLAMCGEPTEIDSMGSNINSDGSKSLMEVWQYGEVGSDHNQRVEFTGGKVDSEVIADGTKYDKLMFAFMKHKLSKEELDKQVEKINQEGCK